MGSGASMEHGELTDEEKAKLAELKQMSPEAQQELAMNAMKDTLSAAVTYAIQTGKTSETWVTDNKYKIPCPKVGDFQDIAESVGKIPLVGKGLASAVMAPVEKVIAAFADAAKTVFEAPTLAVGLNEVVANIDVATAIALGQKGGFAYSEFLITTAQEKLSATLNTIVEEVLKTHSVTTVWGGAIDAYNAAAAKVPGVDQIEFDLSDYVMAQVMASLGAMIFERESYIRSGNVEGMSEAVQKVYGGGQPKVEEQIKSIILVKKGDARAIAFADPFPPSVDRSDVMDSTMTKGVQLISKGGLVLVQKWSTSRKVGASAYWCQVGLGQVGQVAEDGKIGRPLSFVLGGKCLTTRVLGEEKDDAVCALDLANARYFEGNGIGVMSSENGVKHTLRGNGGRDWVRNEDGTISPAKSGWGLSSGEWVLGVKLIPDGQGFKVGGGKTY